MSVAFYTEIGTRRFSPPGTFLPCHPPTTACSFGLQRFGAGIRNALSVAVTRLTRAKGDAFDDDVSKESPYRLTIRRR